MRGKTKTAEATIVAVQPTMRGMVSTSKKGERRNFEFVLDVRPTDEPPFRSTVEQKVWSAFHPNVGDVVGVSIRLKDRALELDIDDDPRYQPIDDRAVGEIGQLAQIAFAEMEALEKSGVAAEASVVGVDVQGLVPQLRLQTSQITVEVPTRDGARVRSAFMLYFPVDATPKVGDDIWVSYDPNNPSYVRFRPKGSPAAATVASMRWRVPEACPSCGARVDQSFASTMAHPKCHMCDSPLPCEPLADA